MFTTLDPSRRSLAYSIAMFAHAVADQRRRVAGDNTEQRVEVANNRANSHRRPVAAG
jgi:hypothetical protein